MSYLPFALEYRPQTFSEIVGQDRVVQMLRVIEEMLGHADLATTSIYLHISAPHLQAAVALHPLTA